MKGKRSAAIAAALLLALAGGFFLYSAISDLRRAPEPVTADPGVQINEPPEAKRDDAPAPTVDEPAYASPIDFTALRAVNADICAWLDMADGDISYPVVAAPPGDFYLNHDSDGNRSGDGAIFLETEYNHEPFEDPVTILYGHRRPSGAMFGKLQPLFSDAAYVSDAPDMKIYTESGELTYRFFAAVPYSSSHILYYFDFSDPQVFSDFFEGIMHTRDMGSQFAPENVPEAGDKVLILSTCLYGDAQRRFLVMGKLLSD